MIRLTINNQSTEVPEGITLLQAIEKTGVKIPTLCHHKALTPYGACRFCVVEVQAPGQAGLGSGFLPVSRPGWNQRHNP